MRIAYRLIITCIPLALGACAAAIYYPVAQCSGPVSRVEVLRQMPPEGTYRTCGSIRIDAGGLASDETTLRAVTDEARKYGANAVVIMKNPSPEFTLALGYSRQGNAVAIRKINP
ncbi:MAG: hypothetical protein KIT13_01995 [Burkholderiales bacterium]|nr:hypothetical protein [Burkholderiales bacterium]